MDLPAIDRTLAQLRAAVDAMSTNLVDLESDAIRTRLDQAPLTGVTAQRWADARNGLTWLWQGFSQLNDLLERAAQLRGTRSRLEPATLSQLEQLVVGPSIELSTTDIPLAQRGLLGPTASTSCCSPQQLLERMRQAFDQVMAVIGVCAQQWQATDTRLAALENQLADVARLDDQGGGRHRAGLDRARSELRAAEQAMSCDPLAASPAPLDTLAATLSSLGDDLRRQLKLRDTLAAQIQDARAQLGQLQATAAAASAARAEAVAKIANPAVIDPPPSDRLGAELDRAASLAAGGDWQAADNLLVQWTTRCRDAMATAERALAANQAPIAARNELRGRLDAYRGKAYRLGLLENPTVAGLHAEAQRALFTAPTDLQVAESLVRRYQEALAGPASREVAR